MFWHVIYYTDLEGEGIESEGAYQKEISLKAGLNWLRCF